MLAEFLLTPDALADDGGESGVEIVRRLQQCLLPSRTVPIALLCRLGGAEWERAASTRIARISNYNHRQDAMALFQKLQSLLCVTRPTVPLSSQTEAGWIAAGLTSASRVPLDRIIVSTAAAPPAAIGVSLQNFLAVDFWEPFENPRLVGRDHASQAKVLTALCTHSDWVQLRLPQIRGGSDDEIVTVRQIIKLSNDLPAGFRGTQIDLHICQQRNLSDSNLIRGVRDELSGCCRGENAIRLTLWPEKHFVNRELLAGDFAKTSTGTLQSRPLWWITMTHVAVGSRDATLAGEAGNTWSLFSRQKAYHRFEQIRAATPLKSEVLG